MEKNNLVLWLALTFMLGIMAGCLLSLIALIDTNGQQNPIKIQVEYVDNAYSEGNP